MPAKKKAAKTTATPTTSGVAVNTDQAIRHKDGVAVRIPDVPAQSAGSDNGQSAGNEEN